MTVFPISAVLFVVGGVFLSIFGLRHLVVYLKDRSNVVNWYYVVSSLSISLALCLYGLPSIFGASTSVIAAGGIAATVANVFGFGSLLLIPVYNWFGGSPLYIVMRYIVNLFVVFLATLLIVLPPHPTIDSIGAIHWGFNYVTSLPALAFMLVAFGLNAVLLVQHFRRLKDIAPFTVISLFVTFVVTGLSGSYLYVGDNGWWLMASSVLMPIGLMAVFFSSLKGLVARK